MAQSAFKPCASVACGVLVSRKQRWCDACRTKREAEDRDQRGTAHERGYTSRWHAYRRLFLKEHPLCVECEREGSVTPATVVDHITAHKGDPTLFWDVRNHRALCKTHHDARVDEGDFGRSA